LEREDNMANLFLVQRKSMCTGTFWQAPEDVLRATCPETRVEWQGWERQTLSFRWTTPFGSLAIL
jgi:hypothetical protein